MFSAFVVWVDENPGKLGLALFFFHLFVSSLMYTIACSPYLTDMHNGHGLWNFSPDSFGYDKEAVFVAAKLQAGDISTWWHWHYPHVRLIALVYYLLSPSPISFAPVSALIWLATVFTVYATARLLIPDNRNLAVLGTMIFSFMPTYLLQSTQLTKDPLYILGVSVLFLFLTRILKGRFSWKLMFLATLATNLCLVLRHYMETPLLLIIGTIFMVVYFFVPEIRRQTIMAVLVFFVVLYIDPFGLKAQGHYPDVPFVGAGLTSGTESTGLTSGTEGTGLTLITSRYLNAIVETIQQVRVGFLGSDAGSEVDDDVVLKEWDDGLYYLPRALAIGLLAPFPSDWLEPAHTAGRGARLMAGAEMMILYVLIVGFAIFMFSPSSSLRLRLCLLLFSFSFVLLLGMAIPNVGAIYRMRYAYLLPVILGGLQGWWLVLSGRYSVFSHNRGSEA